MPPRFDIRLTASVSVLLVALACTALFVCGASALHFIGSYHQASGSACCCGANCPADCECCCDNCHRRPDQPPPLRPLRRPTGAVGGWVESDEPSGIVNEAAAREMKQQAGGSGARFPAQSCINGNCQPNWNQANPFNLRPGERLLAVDPQLRPVAKPVGTAPAVAAPPVGAPPLTAPPTKTMPAAGAAQPPAKPVQLLLFLDNSPQSQRLVSWFRDDPALSSLRTKADFQVYTAQSPLYATRFAPGASKDW